MRILDKNYLDYSKGRRLAMSPIKHYVFLFSFLLMGNFLCAQEGSVSSGGEAKGTGGFMSFSVGQIDYINIK